MKFEKRDAPGTSVPQEEEQGGNKPVGVYIMILFIAAFLLMALSFFMHQRSNTEALGELQDSVSTMQQVQINQEKIINLQDKLAIAEEELEESNKALEALRTQQEAAQKARAEKKKHSNPVRRGAQQRRKAAREERERRNEFFRQSAIQAAIEKRIEQANKKK